jgi:hypothetical protein
VDQDDWVTLPARTGGVVVETMIPDFDKLSAHCLSGYIYIIATTRFTGVL